MCQLLGVVSNKKVDINFSLREFRHRGENNWHGWGFGFYQNKKWTVIKKPSSLSDENLGDKDFAFKSDIIIGHVRLASCGIEKHQNTHPFERNGWVFAHNGTVESVKNFPLERFFPKGETDSEHAFCYLLEKIEKDPSNVEKILAEEAEKIKKLGAFNFLLSDGNVLYAFGDTDLHYVKREAPFSMARLKDDNYEVHIQDIKARDERAVIIATNRLTTNENWMKIKGLKVFKKETI